MFFLEYFDPKCIFNSSEKYPDLAEFEVDSNATMTIMSTSCNSSPCLNNGICINSDLVPEGYRCECAKNWFGQNCDEQEDFDNIVWKDYAKRVDFGNVDLEY